MTSLQLADKLDQIVKEFGHKPTSEDVMKEFKYMLDTIVEIGELSNHYQKTNP
jgi:hypothetical protein